MLADLVVLWCVFTPWEPPSLPVAFHPAALESLQRINRVLEIADTHERYGAWPAELCYSRSNLPLCLTAPRLHESARLPPREACTAAAAYLAAREAWCREQAAFRLHLTDEFADLANHYRRRREWWDAAAEANAPGGSWVHRRRSLATCRDGVTAGEWHAGEWPSVID